MSRKICKTIYTFDELSESAKEKARDWYRELIDVEDYSSTIEDAAEIGELMGIEFDGRTHRGQSSSEPCIRWSGFSSQGDGACFEGTYRFKEGFVEAVKEFAPVDERLHRIAEGLYEIQKANDFQLVATVKHIGNYSHSGSTIIVVEKEDYENGESEDYENGESEVEVTADAFVTVNVLLRDFMHWIYRQLDLQNDYLNSDESIDERILCNGYEFDEDGERVDWREAA